MISPLALVSVWAALKLKLITWHHLQVWIALFEVRCWRDSMEPEQHKLFEFTAKQIAQALGKIKAGPRLQKVLQELERLRLASLTPTEISFTLSLDDLPADLRAETDRMLKSLGTGNVTRPMRMPRRIMRLIMKSRVRPLRAAVVFGMLLRIMPVKRYGRYKGCLTTALLVDLSGFNKSRIMHERASLVREGYFERLDTPSRVRQHYGDWYALPHNVPVFSGSKNEEKRQSSASLPQRDRQPPIKEPVPSFGIETNQYLPENPGASPSISTPKAAEVPTWSCMVKEDFQEPRRRNALYEDACRNGLIGESPADRLMFYSAMARARRLGSINPCGMFRRIVETAAYHRHITGWDEDQGRLWMAEDQPMDPDIATARNFVHCIMQATNDGDTQALADGGKAEEPIIAEQSFENHAGDSVVATYLTQKWQQAGFSSRNAFNLIRTTHEGKQLLAGWDQDRWNRAFATVASPAISPRCPFPTPFAEGAESSAGTPSSPPLIGFRLDFAGGGGGKTSNLQCLNQFKPKGGLNNTTDAKPPCQGESP